MAGSHGKKKLKDLGFNRGPLDNEDIVPPESIAKRGGKEIMLLFNYFTDIRPL